MKLRPKIDQHDYETKKGHVERFLKAGDKVKITIMFRGREQSRPELGLRLLARLAEDVEELGYVEANPKQDGRNMLMVLAPHRRKSDASRKAKAESEVDDDVDVDARASTDQRAKTDKNRPKSRRRQRVTSRLAKKEEGLMPKQDPQRCRSIQGHRIRQAHPRAGQPATPAGEQVHKRTRRLMADDPVSKADTKKVNKLLGR